jgi:ParB family chromosome partitioning protein
MTAAAAKVQAISAAGPVVSGSGLSIRTLPRVALHAAPWNARTSFDEDAMRGLCASIREHGILVPLIVRPLPLPHLHSSKEADADVDGYEIVAGHRRFLVASELKIEELPCDVRRLNDQEAREIALTDNLQRSDLSALEEAEGYQQMFQLAGDAGRKLTPADVAAKVGKPEAHVRLRLRLFSAESQVREALRAGSIQLGHALELARLEPAVQKQLLHWLLFEQYGAGAESKTKRRDVPSLAELRIDTRAHRHVHLHS